MYRSCAGKEGLQKTMDVIYVASTHWDREWYEPFQAFRFHLVELMDEMLDTLANNSNFACFQTDGQSILLEDYLEIRPEREDQIKQFAEQNRLWIGPWYTMPDEYLAGTESLVRNLEEGIRIAKNFGNDSRAGFVCDIFGHCSQLPQIFKGFGINNAYLFRGINRDTTPGLFRWKSPDGSAILGVHLGPEAGYSDYAIRIRKAMDHDTTFTMEQAAEELQKYLPELKEYYGEDTVLLLDGIDHLRIDPDTPDLLEAVSKKHPEFKIRFGSLDDFADAIIPRLDDLKCEHTGELREASRIADSGAWLIPGVLSSHIRQKQANHACETLLTRWVEPFAHLAGSLCSMEYPDGFLHQAWRQLLQNHAHDSICGCSPDQIHQDMDYRFDQVRLIADKVIDQTLQTLAAHVDHPELENEDFTVTVFNPAQVPIEGPVDLELLFDKETKSRFGEFFNFEWKAGFRIYDPEGNEIPYDYQDHIPDRRAFVRPFNKTPHQRINFVVKVTAPLSIPAMGYTTLTVKPIEGPTRHPANPIVQSDRTLENEFLRVEVEPNGSLTLHDKESGNTWNRLLIFEDCADIGDGWYHGVAVNDQAHSSTASPADVAIAENGSFAATLEVTNRMSLPDSFVFGETMRRNTQRKELCITNRITLRRGQKHLEVTTTLDNNIRDHRLRVLFTAGTNAKTYLADGPFDVIERDIALPENNYTYKELAVETTPQMNWTGVFSGSQGLAVVAPGLPESAVRDQADQPIALTLLRSFSRTVFTNGEEKCQSQGHHQFRYNIVPLDGTPDAAKLGVMAQQIAGGVKISHIRKGEQAPVAKRTLAKTCSPLTVKSGKTLLTACRQHPTQGCLELRLYNPTDDAVKETISVNGITEAIGTDMEGNAIDKPVKASKGSFEIELKPRQIRTFHCS